MRTILLVSLLASLVLAGCASNGGDAGGPLASTPLTTTEARSLLASAGDNMPDRYGMTMTVTKGSAEVMRMAGAFDNATGEAYMDVTMDPAAFPEMSGGMEGMDALFANGFAVYTTSDGNAYIINDTVFTFPADDSDSSFVPSPDESPFGEFMDPGSAFGDLGENVTVHSVTPITHKGKAAAQIVATVQDEDAEMTNATIIVYRDPVRLARISGEIPASDDDDDDDPDPLAGGLATVDLAYDDEVDIAIPQKAKRAIGLRYTSDATGFGGFGDSDGPTTWTFNGSAGIALGEVEARVKDPEGMGGEESGVDTLSKAETLWSMKLSEGTKTQDGLTLTFDDADGDGKVSPGDTLVIAAGDDAPPPQVVLFDTVTGVHVVPGAGVLLVALALAAAAGLTLHRK